ncbi:MAG: AbrB/MazE/SpoVT family DNA-binding domain-containing protein [Ponticaulis sp.]|nr:AbrB/MazE/SpoVT family DNA-binding domain-containing protein [Ponticaulis sp.]
MKHVKIRKIGNSYGVILPKEEIERRGLSEGDTINISDTDTGWRFDVYDPEVSKQVDAGREIANRFRNTLRELAK